MMNGTKYSSLPDIDTAPDIYETPDVVESWRNKDELSDDETLNTRPGAHDLEDSTREDLDQSGLPDRDQVGAKFRQAERRRGRFKELYTYPPSDGSASRSPSPDGNTTRKLPPHARLQRLKAEFERLESDMVSSNGANPTSSDDPEALLRDLTEIRQRLHTLGSSKEMARTSQKLLSRVTSSASPTAANGTESGGRVRNEQSTPDAESISSLDRRLGELEVAVGASNAALDESSPLPQPLLPHIARLSNILTLLTQPRQIDAISRRLKLLQTDLERYSAAQTRRQQATQAGTSSSATGSQPTTLPNLASSEIALILQRLSPALPTIPHLLTRLRTLSTLHTSAAGFASELSELEEEQRKTHTSLEEINRAIEVLEKSFAANSHTMAGNLEGLQARLEDVQARIVKLE